MVAGGFASTLQVRVAESSPAVAGPDNELDAVTFGGSSNAKFYVEGKILFNSKSCTCHMPK